MYIPGGTEANAGLDASGNQMKKLNPHVQEANYSKEQQEKTKVKTDIINNFKNNF